MEKIILESEEKVSALHVEADKISPDDHQGLTKKYKELDAAQKKVSELYERWEELSAKQE